MEQTSKLSIVVDTRTAEGQLKSFRQSLREVEQYGKNMDKSLTNIGSKTQFAGLVASIKSAQSTLLAFSGTAKNSVSAMDAFNVTAKNLSVNTKSIASNLNTSQAALARFANSSKSVGVNLQTTNAAIGQTQTNLMKIIGSFNFATTASGKLSISAKTLKADIAALNAALATGSGSLGRFGQASNAAGAASSAAKARNTELANSYRLVNTGLQSNAQYLQQANKALNANSSASVAAQLNQDKLAISSSKVATAASRAAEASTRAQIATVNLANASSRASAAISDEASAASRAAAASSNAAAAAIRAESATSNLAAANSRAAAASSGAAAAVTGEAAALERAAAAASRAAGAAANAAGAQDRASIAALRLAAAEARAAADADRLAGGLGRANGQAHGFMGTLNSLQGLLMGGMFSIATLGIIKTADEMQNLNSQIKLATKSNEEYLLIRQRVGEIADRNYSAIAATTNLYQNSARALANLGKSQQDVLVFTDAVSLAMRTGGRSTQEQASAILQLSQSMSSNILAGDEFRSLAENAPILLELVAKRMGVLPGQLKALAADGKITGEIIYDALSENIGMLEKMARQMPLTMSQAFTVAKNRYKSYVNDMMNETGGMSGKIASAINGISANFDTLAKVAIAGAGIAFAQLALSIGTASTAMAIFNAVSRANPLILIASGFLAVNSAIFGVNEVLDISGIMVGDFFDQMEIMIGDAGSQWEDFEVTVAKVMGNNTNVIADANDKNSKNFLGFYDKTEKGFAGVIQGISTGVFSLTNIFMSALTVIDNFILNTNSLLNNLGIGLYNAGQKAKGFFGGEDNSKEYVPYADRGTNFLSIYADTFAKGQDSIRDYAQSLNERALPKAKVGEYDPNYVAPIRSGLLRNNFSGVLQGGQGVLANRTAGLPDILRNNQPSTLPMDNEKLRQKIQLDELNALEERKKANDKLAKAQAKADKGLSDRLVGVSGDTGVGNAHLHIQYRDKSRPVSPADLARFKAGDKRITDYPMTSGYGKRNTGIKGASTNHKGTDFGIPKNTPITTNVAVKNVKTWKDGKGGGYVSTITFEDGVVIDLLHQMPSVMGVEKGSSTGNKKIDSMVSKAENTVAKAAAKAEKERIKQAEEAQRERERIAAIDLKLLKEYGDKELQLTLEHDARVAEINESSFNGAKKAELIKESERSMERELAIYKKGLEDRVNEFAKYKQTERDMLKQQHNDDVFSIMSDPVLSRPENKAQLTQAIINANALNEHRVSLYEESLEQQKSAMYAFQKTERDILIDGWDNKLADAELMYDELRDYRIEAIRIEGAQDINTFDTNQALKMLELKKYHMSEIAYIQARDALERKLIDLSNDPDDVKALRKDAMTQAENLKKSDALDSVMNDIKNESPMAKIEADYQRRLEIIDDYESQWTSLVGVHSAERTAIEQSYMDAKRDLMLTQGEALFGELAGLSKSFVGEQSGVYRALFAVEKAFALASAAISTQEAISKAMEAGFPLDIPLTAKAISAGAGVIGAIRGIMPQGFKQGGYTGNMGASQVAGVVHGQEYVFDAQSTKRIGVDNLNAMRSGRAANDSEVNVSVNMINNSSYPLQATSDGQTITITDVNNAVDRGIKRSWTNTGNPNSFESKQLNRNLQAPRRR